MEEWNLLYVFNIIEKSWLLNYSETWLTVQILTNQEGQTLTILIQIDALLFPTAKEEESRRQGGTLNDE